MNPLRTISLPKYPTSKQWQNLATRFDLWVECTQNLQQAPLFLWFSWLQGKLHQKNQFGSPQSLFWFFPSPPALPTTYVWINSALSQTEIKKQIDSIFKTYKSVAIAEHGSGKTRLRLNQNLKLQPVDFSFLLEKQADPLQNIKSDTVRSIHASSHRWGG
jgi:hypothetical protein